MQVYVVLSRVAQLGKEGAPQYRAERQVTMRFGKYVYLQKLKIEHTDKSAFG